jgi:hypothetical protein
MTWGMVVYRICSQRFYTQEIAQLLVVLNTPKGVRSEFCAPGVRGLYEKRKGASKFDECVLRLDHEVGIRCLSKEEDGEQGSHQY